MWFLGYNILLSMVFVLIVPFTPLLQFIGKRFSAGLAQRLGYFPPAQVRAMAGARPVWIHASSVGEVGSVAALVRELKNRHPQRRIMLSTFTATGNESAQKCAGVDAVIYFPLDFLWTVRRALTQWNPSLMLFVETEIWPNMLGECFRRGIPAVLLSGRLSARSFPRYQKFRGFFRQVLRRFAAIGMQTGEDAARIVRLGADAHKVSVVGSLKWAGAVPPPSQFTDVPRHGKKLLIAGSTHAGEEQMLLTCFAALRPRFPELSMVLAPRHPERFGEVEALLRNSGFSWCRRSAAAADRLFAKDVLLLDTVGELSQFFALGDVAFVGGSLVDVGGHNILEPARSGKAIAFGPYMANVQAIAETFTAQGAAVQVADSAALSAALANLLSDDAKRIGMGRLALAASANGDGAVQRNYALVARYLSESLGSKTPIG
jgi:3-deoxy-D-manno-octulosonic-acid transferase